MQRIELSIDREKIGSLSNGMLRENVNTILGGRGGGNFERSIIICIVNRASRRILYKTDFIIKYLHLYCIFLLMDVCG